MKIFETEGKSYSNSVPELKFDLMNKRKFDYGNNQNYCL